MNPSQRTQHSEPPPEADAPHSEIPKSEIPNLEADKKTGRSSEKEDALFLGAIGERRLGAYTMRVKSGASYRDIARAYHVDVHTAYSDVQAVQSYFRRTAYESIEDVREQQAARLDMALFAVMPQVKKGDYFAIKSMLAIEKRRSALLGLDAPNRTELTGKNGGPVETENIREKWSPEEATARTNELLRRMEVINRQNVLRRQSK